MGMVAPRFSVQRKPWTVDRQRPATSPFARRQALNAFTTLLALVQDTCVTRNDVTYVVPSRRPSFSTLHVTAARAGAVSASARATRNAGSAASARHSVTTERRLDRRLTGRMLSGCTGPRRAARSG